jgi:hypothetical protein
VSNFFYFKCEHCRCEFSTARGLRDHMQTKHGAPVVEDVSPDPKVEWRLTENDKTMLKKLRITPA